jgi:uncharacterized Ntn-hydrolase superfamily protein
MARAIVATYSIVACDLEAGQWGVATQSKFLAVGSVVPWAVPGVGAVATQAYANPRYGPQGLQLLAQGLYTGSDCLDWAGGLAGPGFAAQGNILVGEETVAALATTFTATDGQPLAERLLECLAAAQAAGGDRRGQQSAALLVVEQAGGYAGLSDSLVDLRVDDHEEPVAELARLYAMHTLLFGKTPRERWIDVDDELRAELADRLGRLGYTGELERALGDWSGTENLEERVDGVRQIDPVVLAELRKR